MVARMRFKPSRPWGPAAEVRHVHRDQIIQRGVVTRLLRSEHIVGNFFRAALVHAGRLFHWFGAVL